VSNFQWVKAVNTTETGQSPKRQQRNDGTRRQCDGDEVMRGPTRLGIATWACARRAQDSSDTTTTPQRDDASPRPPLGCLPFASPSRIAPSRVQVFSVKREVCVPYGVPLHDAMQTSFCVAQGSRCHVFDLMNYRDGRSVRFVCCEHKRQVMVTERVTENLTHAGAGFCDRTRPG